MHKNTRRHLATLSAVLSVAMSACASAPQIDRASPQATTADRQTACEKADAMWHGKILPSRYSDLPPLTELGLGDLFTLTRPEFSLKAFTQPGDEMEGGRRKRVHAFGAEARLNFVVGAESGYTGIFSRGSSCIIGRFSMANRPTPTSSIPALALKVFIDGEQPSLNLHLMHSVDGQAGHNFFAEPFSNILPPAQSLATRLLDGAFGRVAIELDAVDPNPGRLTLEHLASTSPEGHITADSITPYRLILRPTPQAFAAIARQPDTDFRTQLAALPIGTVLYDVEAVSEAGTANAIGRLILTSNIVASRYGDETLYFRHHTARRPTASRVK